LWVKDFFYYTKKGERKMKPKKSFVKPLAAAILLVVVVAVMAVVYIQLGPHSTKGKKEVTIEVVVPNEETKEFTLNTDAEYLRQALEEKDLIKGKDSDYGFYITEVNGRVADEAKQEWWCITQDGATVNYGVDQIAIKDGDHYELTLTVGY
jgi:hypothetical protein